MRLTVKRQTYVEVRDVVVQQGLDVVNTLLGTNKGKRDHSLRQQITKTTAIIIADCKPQLHRGQPRCSIIRLTSCRGCFVSLSPSILTLTTPDLSTISWMTLPFLPITLPTGRKENERKELSLNQCWQPSVCKLIPLFVFLNVQSHVGDLPSYQQGSWEPGQSPPQTPGSSEPSSPPLLSETHRWTSMNPLNTHAKKAAVAHSTKIQHVKVI